MDYKSFLGLLAVVLGFASSIPYIRDVFLNKTKPHVFTWFLWGLSEAIVFAIQIQGSSGPGAWATGLASIICFSIAAASYFKGYLNFAWFDWVSLIGSLLALVFWLLADNPLVAIILLIISDLLSFLMTFRKSYYKPYEETLSNYYLSSLKSLVAIFALNSYLLTNWLFLSYLVFINMAFVVMSLWRRRQISN